LNLFILDTDHVSLFQRAHPLVIQRIAAVDPRRLAVTIVTAEEQLRGWLSTIRRADSSAALVRAYSRLRLALEYFQTVQILDFDDAASDLYNRLRQQKLRIGTQDLRIAAIVLSVDSVLVTRNARDFSKIGGLKFEDWSIG
jgi:tRNA(fMet)-specific endonuclease VapC